MVQPSIALTWPPDKQLFIDSKARCSEARPAGYRSAFTSIAGLLFSICPESSTADAISYSGIRAICTPTSTSAASTHSTSSGSAAATDLNLEEKKSTWRGT